jgi:hypothetical protein
MGLPRFLLNNNLVFSWLRVTCPLSIIHTYLLFSANPHSLVPPALGLSLGDNPERTSLTEPNFPLTSYTSTPMAKALPLRFRA